MKLVVKPSRVCGSVSIPGSKSHTIRAVCAALMAEGTSIIHAPLKSADTLSTLNAAEKLGAKVLRCPDRWEITGTGGRMTDPGCALDMGNSGTGTLLLAALCATQDFPVTFAGDASLRSRPMSPLLDALKNLGCSVQSTDGKCPFTVHGPLSGGETQVDGHISQYLSALLFAAPYAKESVQITLTSLNERPYVMMTRSWLERLGVLCNVDPDGLEYRVFVPQRFRRFEWTIPADFSTAAFPLAAAVLAGDGVELKTLDFKDTQGDQRIFIFLEAMGGRFDDRGKTLFVNKTKRLRPGEIDLNATPDALPIMAAFASVVQGTTYLINVAQARIKETDRISCMARELGKLGVRTEELPDGLVIHGGTLRGGEVDGCGDHRIVMALAVAALCAQEPTVIHGAEAAAVTYPGFFEDFRNIGAQFALDE